MSLPTSYADQADLAGYWRPLTDAEQARATVLLGAAADRINELPNAATFVVSACKWVSLDMVKRAMIGGGGEKAESQSMIGMSVNRTFTNPMGDLYLTSKEINRLNGRYGQSAGSVTLSSNTQVPLTPWSFQRSSQTDVHNLTVCPETLTLTVGATRQLQVTMGDDEYEDRTAYATFTTSDESVATVTGAGVVTAVDTGEATITADYQGLSATCTVTVA
jgi:hypothetical protein